MSPGRAQKTGTLTPLLSRSLERGRLAHAYLFTGNDLSDLEIAARGVARTVNCERPTRRSPQGVPLDFCGRCPNCRRVEQDTHPDVHWVRPESKLRVITISQVRDLMHEVQMKPAQAAFKVGVIVAADRLNVQAANAFLKTLEEPPANSLLLLLTSEPQQILETILSRCLRLNLGGGGGSHLSKEQKRWLETFAALAASEQKGLLGRYRLLAAVLARLGEIKEQVERALTAQSPLERYDEVEPKLREKWEDELAAAIEAEYRRKRSELLVGLIWWFRDVWFISSGYGQDLLSYPELVAQSQAVARRIKEPQAVENLATLERTHRLLGSNVQEALAVEVGFLRLHLAEAVSA